MVIPVKTGIYFSGNKMDLRFRGDDKSQKLSLRNSLKFLNGVLNK